MEDILKALYERQMTPAEALELLGHSHLSVEDCADLDAFRKIRTGIPEVVLCEGKSVPQINAIIRSLLPRVHRLILSRLASDVHSTLRDLSLKALGPDIKWEFDREARVLVISDTDLRRVSDHGPVVAVITGGTSDIPVAREAEIMLREMGCDVISFYDVGVAGLHRLVPVVKELTRADVKAAVVAAGREGTLPVVISGLVSFPVIGLPVSIGYGRGGHGEAALMTMLQSCSPLTVVNIDAGITAGACAGQIAMGAVVHPDGG